MTVAKSPLSQRSEQGDILRLRIGLVALESGKMTTENHTNSNFTWQVRVAVHTACNAVVHDFENRGKARMQYNKRLLQLDPGNE